MNMDIFQVTSLEVTAVDSKTCADTSTLIRRIRITDDKGTNMTITLFTKDLDAITLKV